MNPVLPEANPEFPEISLDFSGMNPSFSGINLLFPGINPEVPEVKFHSCQPHPKCRLPRPDYRSAVTFAGVSGMLRRRIQAVVQDKFHCVATGAAGDWRKIRDLLRFPVFAGRVRFAANRTPAFRTLDFRHVVAHVIFPLAFMLA